MGHLENARQRAAELVDLRHRLHRQPELGLDLPRTQRAVLDSLAGLPLELSLGDRSTSVTAVLRGGAGGAAGPAPVVLLRGDMDALPVAELADVPFRSEVDGCMHACGHDLHTAMLVGGAHLLAGVRDRLPGDVVFMFQPGEETNDGASVMIGEGVLDAAGRRADRAFALHVFAQGHPAGRFVTKPGPMLSASDAVQVTVLGRGGHGSAPHLAADPVPALAEMITALNTLVTRGFDVFDPIVISVGVVRAGTVRNVIPETASFEATIRTYSDASRDRVLTRLPRLLEGIAAAHGLTVRVEHEPGYPVTINDREQTAFAEQVAREVFGDDRHVELAAPMGASEDFSRVLAEVPGSFVGLGATPRGVDPATAPFNHSPYAAYDDDVLPSGAAMYAELAERSLRRLAAG